MTHHVSCHECDFDALIEGAFATERAIERHQEETSHRVSQEYVAPEEGYWITSLGYSNGSIEGGDGR
ncbi:hypothetical protein G3I44_16495 [Halogeometricum borinquense]|uniref:Uncharacterized protein n=1 Tax=Halogeometricum borinquense TaxID=60847 RepID=A0A6C0UCJ5_9EURY|nr:hypothetical protein [Halogeometricum borinquense]QIB72807.1 hypothetical protein G3I44_16495 [Halogeometricum borinquense]